MNEIEKTKTGTETGTETRTETRTEIETGTEPGRENGSPITRTCANSVSQGTADEPSTAENIKFPENERTVITAAPVPLDRLPQALSREIHTYKGIISEISIRRGPVGMTM
ncbi:hypothetical protein [Methanogenium sp. MK-MG]|uniref:hypothetical protein n=1 Tax=Methanogenium sp. MK-MG TaxID=2599926 RepID=UPI0013E9EBC8|nr:hypothetical protein [Methanogenium sp. MK-MG]KAF1075085.1 hypothetical protein MKMG_01795 [Methanogenium sp. MK-MG]